MAEDEARDQVIVEDEAGHQHEYNVEALFDMEEHTYALLKREEDLVLMRVEGDEEDQYLVGIKDPEEAESILNAYQIAVEAAPAED